MKKLLFIVAAMFAAVSFSSCDKDDDNGGGSDFARPALPDPNDVCSCMDDLVFMQYCYENFDVNKDGKVSKTEANAVTKIDLGYTYNYQDAYDVKTLTGICYFPNLEIINCSNCKRLTSVDLSHNLKITVIQSETFYYCSDLKSIILPNSVTRIGKSAFYGCSSLTNITIPNSVTTIKSYTFYGCSSLTNITIPNSVTTIEDAAFLGCSSLTNITIPNSVTTIKSYTFYGCSSLTNITIPNSVTTIEDAAFDECSKLKEIYCTPTNPPTLVENKVFNSIVLYVPMKSVDAYKQANGWKKYANQIVGYDF